MKRAEGLSLSGGSCSLLGQGDKTGLVASKSVPDPSKPCGVWGGRQKGARVARGLEGKQRKSPFMEPWVGGFCMGYNCS